MGDLLSLSEAAEFLGISRPTFNVRRLENKFNEITDGNKTLIKKSDLLGLYAKEQYRTQFLNLIVTEDDSLEKILIDKNTFDLRLINLIDGYGIISLITVAVSILESGESLYIISGDTSATRILKAAGFFSELKRRFENRVFYNEDVSKISDVAKPYLALHYLAYKGQERKMLENLVPLLTKQNFNSDVVGHLGWITGELADNSLTHAKGPCYVLIGQFNATNNYIELAIGDTGKGIHRSLKENPKYKALSDQEAFLKSFQPRVSCWSDDKERGKGLCDLLIVAIGNGALLRVDSKEMGLMFNFTNGQREAMKRKPASKYGGARFCLLLINDQFLDITREEVDRFIERERVRLCEI